MLLLFCILSRLYYYKRQKTTTRNAQAKGVFQQAVNHLAIVDESGKPVLKKKSVNDSHHS